MDGNKPEANKEIYMQLFKSLINEISSSSSDVLLNGAEKLLDNDTVAKYVVDRKIQPYLYLSGMLNLLGRDIDAENISKVLKGIGIEPDGKIIEALLNANNENGVIYVYSIYFLLILGRERTTKNIMDLVSSLGAKPNEVFAQNALDFYNKKYGEKP